jgi:hypothetical protein
MPRVALAFAVLAITTLFWWTHGIPACEAGSKPGPTIGDAIKINGC